MSTLFLGSQKVSFSPLNPHARSFRWRIGAVVVGTLVLSVASQLEVPTVPVPLTLQTLAVTLVGALYGWRLGTITIVCWLLEAAVGLPVLAGGAGGLQHFVGPTAGYLLAFPVVGGLVGWLAEQGWNGRRMLFAFVSMLIGNAVCLVLGAAWLVVLLGMEQAILTGVMPFLAGGIIKSALGAAILRIASGRGVGRPT